MPKRKTPLINTDIFLERIKKVHEDKYDYSKVVYIDSKTPIIVICKKHGEFAKTSNSHLREKGCPKCRLEGRRSTKKSFIKSAKKIHGDKYDYSKSEYTILTDPITITCKIHGDFILNESRYHLEGSGCHECAKENLSKKRSRLRRTTKEFIAEANFVHDNKYNYEKAEYKGSVKEIAIICPEHGEFSQRASAHLQGFGCKKCHSHSSVRKKKKPSERRKNGVLTKDEIIKRAKKLHGNRYDYSKFVYNGRMSKAIIICSEHGKFKQTVNNHLQGSNCPKCSKIEGSKKSHEKMKRSKKEFVDRAHIIHKWKYDYSKFIYVNRKTNGIIICPNHGDFPQTPTSHIDSGSGCPKCAGNVLITVAEFIEKANFVHKYKYDYSLVKIEKSKEKVKIICPSHGVFDQYVGHHLNGSGCTACYLEARYDGPAILYYLEFYYKNTGKFYRHKIGVTQQTVQRRFSGLNPRLGYRILMEYDTDITNAYSLEQGIIKEFKNHSRRAGLLENNVGGVTECFTNNLDVKDIKSFVVKGVKPLSKIQIDDIKYGRNKNKKRT